MLVKILDKFNSQAYPLDDTAIDVPDEILALIKEDGEYCFDVENNCVIPYDNTEYLLNSRIQELRQRREQECFTIINRGSLWYDSISGLQLEELEEWYHKWLDVTITLEAPEKPEWLK